MLFENIVFLYAFSLTSCTETTCAYKYYIIIARATLFSKNMETIYRLLRSKFLQYIIVNSWDSTWAYSMLPIILLE